MNVQQPLNYLREYQTPGEAQTAATDEATATAGRVLSATLFQQGGRQNLALAMTMADLQSLVRRDSAPARGDVKSTVNRPFMSDHAKTIESYLVTNAESYILPSITLTVDTDVAVFTVHSPSPLRAAWVVVRSDTRFFVTDGQHRLVALTGSHEPKSRVVGAVNQVPELNRDGVAVHLVFEKNIERIHQDFADAARTKQIPASMLAAYNMREPFNKLLSDVVEGSTLFRDRVDLSSKTLSKRSQKMFLLNQIRGFLKELIIGDYAASEDAVARAAVEQLGTQEQRDAATKRAVELIATLSAEMKPWTELVAIPVGGPEANRIPAARETYLNMTATGLNLIGRVGYVVFTNASDPSVRHDYFHKLANLRWEKADQFWSGTVIAPHTVKLLTQRGPLDLAFHKVRKEIGISTDWLPARWRKKALLAESRPEAAA